MTEKKKTKSKLRFLHEYWSYGRNFFSYIYSTYVRFLSTKNFCACARVKRLYWPLKRAWGVKKGPKMHLWCQKSKFSTLNQKKPKIPFLWRVPLRINFLPQKKFFWSCASKKFFLHLKTKNFLKKSHFEDIIPKSPWYIAFFQTKIF